MIFSHLYQRIRERKLLQVDELSTGNEIILEIGGKTFLNAQIALTSKLQMLRTRQRCIWQTAYLFSYAIPISWKARNIAQVVKEIDL